MSRGTRSHDETGTHDERGAATVVAVALAGLLCIVCLAVAGAIGVVAAHRRAQAAADLAALAAATALQRGEDPCREAASIAEANGGLLTGCTPHDDLSVLVVVTVRGPTLAGQQALLRATARAGPEEPLGP